MSKLARRAYGALADFWNESERVSLVLYGLALLCLAFALWKAGQA